MLALKITDIKDFMTKLLLTETFDSFELVEAAITTFNVFSIDGHLQRDFFDTDTRDILDQNKMYYSRWKEIRPYCYSVIRGRHTPLHFRIIFRLPTQHMVSSLLQLGSSSPLGQVDGFYLNLQYKNTELLCTSGISTREFLPDKSPEHLWDSMVTDMFHAQKISAEGF